MNSYMINLLIFVCFFYGSNGNKINYNASDSPDNSDDSTSGSHNNVHTSDCSSNNSSPSSSSCNSEDMQGYEYNHDAGPAETFAERINRRRVEAGLPPHSPSYFIHSDDDNRDPFDCTTNPPFEYYHLTSDEDNNEKTSKTSKPRASNRQNIYVKIDGSIPS